jgi:hypothetical protein
LGGWQVGELRTRLCQHAERRWTDTWAAAEAEEQQAPSLLETLAIERPGVLVQQVERRQ